MVQYTQSIITEEWRANVDGTKPPASNAHLNRISRGMFSFVPKNLHETQIYGMTMEKLTKLFDHRVKRLQLNSYYQLSAFFWNAIILMLFLLAVLAFFEKLSVEKILALSGQAMGLGLLLGLVFIYDHPFLGDAAVSARPFVETLHLVTQRT